MVVTSANDFVIVNSNDFVILDSDDFVIPGSNDFVILGLDPGSICAPPWMPDQVRHDRPVR
jgi:hypothetical protein